MTHYNRPDMLPLKSEVKHNLVDTIFLYTMNFLSGVASLLGGSTLVLVQRT